MNDAQVLERLLDDRWSCRGFTDEQVPRDVVERESGWQLYDAVGVAKGDREASALQMLRNFEFFGAPHAAIITTDAELVVYGAIDCGLSSRSSSPPGRRSCTSTSTFRRPARWCAESRSAMPTPTTRPPRTAPRGRPSTRSSPSSAEVNRSGDPSMGHSVANDPHAGNE
ncbi:MAG: hypothetical protein WAL70_03985 [Aeromicrobium sp.]